MCSKLLSKTSAARIGHKKIVTLLKQETTIKQYYRQVKSGRIGFEDEPYLAQFSENELKDQLVRVKTSMYTFDRAFIASNNKTTVTLKTPLEYEIPSGYGYYFETFQLKHVDKEEEWYLDPNTFDLYFAPPNNLELTAISKYSENIHEQLQVEMRSVSTGIEVSSGVSYLVIENLRMERQVRRAIYFTNKNVNITIRNNEFDSQSVMGISFRYNDGVSDLVIHNNTFSNFKIELCA